jgi:DNA-binding NarL/FixJ family response regulator
MSDPKSAICKVLVAGHCVVRRGVASIVRDVVPKASIVEAASFHEAKARLESEKFFAAIFDVDGRDQHGPVNFRMLRADFPQLIIAVLSLTDNATIILSYLAAGVNGYILGSSDQPEIECAIGVILNRAPRAPLRVSGPDAVQPDQDAAVSPRRQSLRGLTERQNTVLGLLLNGYSNKEIARQLDLSPHTVKIYVSALLRHFSVDRRSDLTIAISPKPNGRIYHHFPPPASRSIHTSGVAVLNSAHVDV